MSIFDDTNEWKQIQAAEKEDCLTLISCEVSKAMVTPAFFSRGADDSYLFLLRYPENEKSWNSRVMSLQGCSAYSCIIQGIPFFVFSLSSTDSWWLFKMLCRSVYETVQKDNCNTNDNFIKSINKVIKQYAVFFRHAHSGSFSREDAIGLYGELLFLQNCLIPVFGAEVSLLYWTGPLGAAKDFLLSEFEFEVKTTESDEKLIKISNLEQLEDSNDTKLYLVLHNIHHADEVTGITLNDLVQDVLKACSGNEKASSEFKGKLHMVGYDVTSDLAEVPYTLDSRTFYLVENDFPRITKKNISPHIRSAKYSLDLDGVSQAPAPRINAEPKS